MEKQLAIIRNVGIGVRDVGSPVLWFDVYTSEAVVALQVFSWKEAYDIIKQAGVYDISKLEGKPCWVEAKNGMIKFVGVWAR